MKCVDLFSGCGGMSLGFLNADFDVVAAFDHWEPTIKVYEENFDHPIFKQDLSNVEDSVQRILPYKPNMIMGGPPCQDFSSAGKRDVSLGRADLTNKFADIVVSVKPEWFVMENVEQIKKSQILQDVVDKFIENGYGLTAVILDASYCGVPQARTRFFLIGHLGDDHNQLVGIMKKNMSETPMTVRDYLGNALKIECYYRHPRNYNRRGVFTIDEPSPTIRGVNRPIPQGYKLHHCDPEGVDLSFIRPLTTIERSYIQTFPKDFVFLGTKTDMEQMIGNAVPVNLGAFIASSIQEYIESGPIMSMKLPFDNPPFEIPEKVLQKK
ncbi:DNA cytosine methyltransferase [Armatimonas sp.]|uniref:DNA cytosine methyltransferase n=1 Tax=Armatimonas sp. TaxID=1872638 RepID=UPI00286BDD17|nr:DNA cytosine methyltransferase [Armatimonas sp.]